MVGKQHRRMLARQRADGARQFRIAMPVVGHQRQPADLHHEIRRQRGNAIVMVEAAHARHGGRMRRMQMDDRTRGIALLVHGRGAGTLPSMAARR